jgi:hypothetical protein
MLLGIVELSRFTKFTRNKNSMNYLGNSVTAHAQLETYFEDWHDTTAEIATLVFKRNTSKH